MKHAPVITRDRVECRQEKLDIYRHAFALRHLVALLRPLRPLSFATVMFVFFVLNPSGVRAEYCVNWSATVQQFSHGGASGHCWPTRKQCVDYYNSRVLSGYSGDFSGSCYYRPGKYPREGATSPGGSSQGANDSARAKRKFKALQHAYDSREQRQFQRQKNQLLHGLKDETVTPKNTIVLKPPPASGPPTGTARKQLNCIVRKSKHARGGNWQKKTDCSPVNPRVPPVPKPTPARN